MPIIGTYLAGPYNTALTIAVIVGLFLAIRAGRNAGYSPLAWRVLLIAAVTGGLIGSTFIFFDFHAPRLGEKSNLGALVVGIAVVIVLGRWLQIGAMRALDTLSIPTLVGMGIGRIGCFLVGCCRGTRTTLPWGVHVDGDTSAIHPVQLYESFLDFAIVAALARWVPMARPGRRVGVAVASYAGIRFATEFVRDGRTAIAGLNAVQWSVLITGLAVVAWLWLLERAQPVRTNMRSGRAAADASRACARNALPQGEARAFLASLFVMTTLLSLAIGLPEAFGSFERVFMVTAACATGFYALFSLSKQRFARPFVPALGAMLLLTPPDSVPKRREIIVGGGIWSGVYSVIVGQGDYPVNSTDCEGNTVVGSKEADVMATRRSTTGWISGGLRQRTSSGRRITVEGQVLTGNDNLQSLGTGDLFAPVAQSTSILAGGAAVSVEGKNQHVRISVLGGRLSNLGSEDQGITGSVTARTGVESGFFLEGNLAPARWYVNTGDFSYAGVGYVVSKEGARVVLGGGLGVYLGVHVPMQSFELDVIGRAPADQSKADNPGPTLSIGLRKAFTLQ